MIRSLGVSTVVCVATASVVLGPITPAFATAADCHTGGTRVAEYYDENYQGSWAGDPHVVIDSAASSDGASLLCVYIRDSWLPYDTGREFGGVVTLRGYQLPPGVVPTVTTDVSGCGPLQTLADGELGDPGGPVHLPYRVAARVEPTPMICVTVNQVGFRVSYALGGVGSPPSVAFEPNVAAVRSSPPAYPVEDSQRPSTSCFYGGFFPSRKLTYLLLPGVRMYYATEDDANNTPSSYTTCYRVEGPGGVFHGAAQTRPTSQRGAIYQSSVSLDEDPSRCTTNVANAGSPVPYSLRYGVYSPYLDLDRYVVCLAVAGVVQTIAITPGFTEDTVLYHVESAGPPPPWQHDTR